MLPKKDYTFHTFLLAMLVIGMLLLIGLIPPFRIGPLKFKQVDILSDLRGASEAQIPGDTLKEYSDTAFTAESLAASSPEALEKALSTATGTSQDWQINSQGVIATPGESQTPATQEVSVTPGAIAAAMQPRADASQHGVPATLIEDFSGGAMERFYELLLRGNPRRPVRIAVLGDSFIEADIITADLREQLQSFFGGQGVGFVPFSSPLAKYRNTVRHTFQGWETYNVIKKNSAPAGVRDRFTISGMVCTPSEGGWARIEGTNFRRGAARSQVARLLFTSEKNSTIEVTVNDSIQSSFSPDPSPLMQMISLRGDIGSLKVCVKGAAGFTGYGVVFESPSGISVDNYSVRSNSGMAIFGTNTSLNAQMGRLLGYDLIILQYGLNAMSPDILNYNTYSGQLVRIINHIKECFPGAAVMVMSVGDRSTQRAGQYVTMPAVKAMLAAQHTAAEQAGVAFWNTFQGMGGERSMVTFVENKWASKDYTHIGYPGGKYIATQMVRSLLYGYRAHNGEALDLEMIATPDYSLPVAQPAATTAAAASPQPSQAVQAHDDSAATAPAPAPAAPAVDSSLRDHPSLPSQTPSQTLKDSL